MPSRPPATRPPRRWSTRRARSGRTWSPRGRAARALRRRCPRGGVPRRHLELTVPVVERALADAGDHAGRRRGGRGHRGAGTDRCPAGRPGQRQGDRLRPRAAAGAGRPPARAHRRAVPAAGAGRPAVPDAACLRRPHASGRSRRPVGLPGDRHPRWTMRPARRSTRAPGCSGSATRGAPSWKRLAAAGRPGASPAAGRDARLARPRLLVQRAEDGAALRRAGGTRGRRPGRVLPARDCPLAGRPDDGGGAGPPAATRWRWSAASPGTARCARPSRSPARKQGVLAGAGAARALLRQRGDDRLGRPLHVRRSPFPDYLDRDAYASRAA